MGEVERLVTIIQNPRQFKVPDWMLNRKKDVKDGKFSQVVSNTLDMKLREDLERLKKIRAHRGLRHYWGLRVRGQRWWYCPCCVRVPRECLRRWAPGHTNPSRSVTTRLFPPFSILSLLVIS